MLSLILIRITTIIESKCDTDPLLHFPYDEHLDDVTCRNAQAQKYGSGRIVFRSSGSRKFICLLGDAHMEVRSGIGSTECIVCIHRCSICYIIVCSMM